MHIAGNALPGAGPAYRGALVTLILRQMSISFCVAALWAATAAGLPAPARAQAANFHPCNSQPSLPMCLHGYGKRIAVQRWGAQPDPLDPVTSFAHVHDMAPPVQGGFGPTIAFDYVFPSVGDYRLWAQVAHHGQLVTIPVSVTVTATGFP